MHNQNVQLQTHLRSEMDLIIARHYLVNVVEGVSECVQVWEQAQIFAWVREDAQGWGYREGGGGWMKAMAMHASMPYSLIYESNFMDPPPIELNTHSVHMLLPQEYISSINSIHLWVNWPFLIPSLCFFLLMPMLHILLVFWLKLLLLKCSSYTHHLLHTFNCACFHVHMWACGHGYSLP